ncbi:MAG: hypothetical protein IJD78_02910 [Clostridia bacterium]|nr:hypothetical protein [Clostridia bacterium]
MKCKFCKAKMSRSDNLCTECGRLKSTPLEPVPDYSDREKGKSLRFFTMGKNYFYKYILFPLVLIPLAGMMGYVILLMISDNNNRFADAVIMCAGVLALIYIILAAITASKCYVEVYKNCIEGRIPAKIPCFTKHFIVYYDDIVRVNVHGIGMSVVSTTRRSSDSHPGFTLITDFGAIDIKGLNDSQAAEIHAHIRAFRRK